MGPLRFISAAIVALYIGSIATAFASFIIPNGGVTNAKIANNAVTTAKINDLAVTTGKLEDGAVTQAKKAALGQQVSSSSGAFSTGSGTAVDVTNLSVTITITGRPVYVGLIGDGSGNTSSIGCENSSGTTVQCYYRLVRVLSGSPTTLNNYSLSYLTVGGSSSDYIISAPSTSINTIDIPSSGTYTYKIQAYVSSSTSAYVNYSKLIAFEL